MEYSTSRTLLKYIWTIVVDFIKSELLSLSVNFVSPSITQKSFVMNSNSNTIDDTLSGSSNFQQIKILRTDNGGEYVNNEMKEMLLDLGIEHQTTIPGTPQQNGAAERLYMTVLDKVSDHSIRTYSETVGRSHLHSQLCKEQISYFIIE